MRALSQALIEDNEDSYLQSRHCSSSTLTIQPAGCEGLVTGREYMEFSSDVYYYPSRITRGWNIINSNDTSLPDHIKNNAYAYFGRAYYREVNTKQVVVITHRGTTPTASNFFSDFQFLISDVPYSFCIAGEFTQYLLTHLLLEFCGRGGCCVYFTGHSLGAALAELSTLSLASNEYPAVTFESPGMKTLAEKNIGYSFCAAPASFTITPDNITKADSLVTGYTAAPNLIDTLGEHFGKVIRLSVPFFFSIDDTYDTANFTIYDPSTCLTPPLYINCLLEVSVYYTILYSLSQHTGIVNSAASQMYNADGSLRITTQYPKWPTRLLSNTTLDCLKPYAYNFAKYALGSFYAACILKEDPNDPSVPLACSTPLIGGVMAYLLPTQVTPMFDCSVGKNEFYLSYDLNAFYWAAYLNTKNNLWQYNSDLLGFVNTLLLHGCPGNQGVTVTGDNSGNTIWTTTNCNDVVTTGSGSDIQYLFCGDDVSTDSGGINYYHYPTDYLLGYPNVICGNKKITDYGNDNDKKQSRIIIDAYVTNSTKGEPEPNGFRRLAGNLLPIANYGECNCDQNTFLFDPDKVNGGIPFFATGLGAGGPLQISTDCSSMRQNGIEVENFHWNHFGINAPSPTGGSVVIGKSGQTNINCDNPRGCIAAVGCGNSGATTINVMTAAPHLVVFGTPNTDIVMTFNIEVETSVNIVGVKIGDFIRLPRPCSTFAMNPSSGTNVGYKDENIKIEAQTANGGELICINCADPYTIGLYQDTLRACDLGSTTTTGDIMDFINSTPVL